MRRLKIRVLSDFSTAIKLCVTKVTVELGGVTETSFGLCRNDCAKVRISFEKVAENKSVWRFFGSTLTMRLMS